MFMATENGYCCQAKCVHLFICNICYFHPFMIYQEPRNQGFRAVVVSPSRELAQQTYREFVRLADGRGFRIHTIDNTAKAAKKFGPKSAGKFGKDHNIK